MYTVTHLDGTPSTGETFMMHFHNQSTPSSGVLSVDVPIQTFIEFMFRSGEYIRVYACISNLLIICIRVVQAIVLRIMSMRGCGVPNWFGSTVLNESI